MALLLRKRLILLETESSYGTDPTPTGADAVLVRDLSITPQSSDVVSRDLIRPYLGASQQLLANTKVECTFSVELAGSGTAGTAPQYGKAIQACGLSETVTANTSVKYEPESSGFNSVTIHYNIDGVRHKVTGCRGNLTLNASVGEIPSLQRSRRHCIANSNVCQSRRSFDLQEWQYQRLPAVVIFRSFAVPFYGLGNVTGLSRTCRRH